MKFPPQTTPCSLRNNIYQIHIKITRLRTYKGATQHFLLQSLGKNGLICPLLLRRTLFVLACYSCAVISFLRYFVSLDRDNDNYDTKSIRLIDVCSINLSFKVRVCSSFKSQSSSNETINYLIMYSLELPIPSQPTFIER